MEYILSSDEHMIKNNCLRYTFQKPIRFQNQYISLTSVCYSITILKIYQINLNWL